MGCWISRQRRQATEVQGMAPIASLFTAHRRTHSRRSGWSPGEKKLLIMMFPGKLWDTVASRNLQIYHRRNLTAGDNFDIWYLLSCDQYPLELRGEVKTSIYSSKRERLFHSLVKKEREREATVTEDKGKQKAGDIWQWWGAQEMQVLGSMLLGRGSVGDLHFSRRKERIKQCP